MQETLKQREASAEDLKPLVADLKSVALQRIIEEVENRGDDTVANYNRSYHRHNR